MMNARAGRQWLLLTFLGLAQLALGCGGGSDAPGAPAPGQCPVDTAPWISIEGDQHEVEWCRMASGIAHGPYRRYRQLQGWLDDGGRYLEVEGAYGYGAPDGAWTHYHDGEGAVAAEQVWRGGLEHGTWRQYDYAGEVVAEQHFFEGRRCGDWLVRVGDQVETLSYPACDSFAEVERPDDAPDDAPPRGPPVER